MAEDTFAERLWEGIDEELRRYDISEEIIANIKKDFIRSFAVGVGAPPVTKIPGVPGAVIANFRINLYNLATAPRKVADSLATTLTHTFLGLPYAEYVEAERIVGGWLADRVRTIYTDEGGRPIFSPAIEESFREWVISSPDRGERRKKTKPLLDALETEYLRRSAEVYVWGLSEIKRVSDPGFIASQAMELEKRGVGEIAGRPINEVFRESHFASQKLSEHRQNLERERTKAEQYRSVGDTARARAHAANARYIEGNLGKDLAVWRKKSRPYREYFSGGARREMEEQRALIQARYYQLKEYIRLRGITLGILNFLRTWHEEGFSGVFREYVWLTTINFIFRKGTPLYYLYPPNLITAAMAKIPVPGLGAINRLRARIAARVLHYQARIKQWFEEKIRRKLMEKWRKFVAVPLKQLARRAVNWLITKLGLKVILAKIGAAIGAAIGTVAPGIGNVIGAVVGAVTTFVVGIIVEKTWKPVLKGTVYLFAGSCACLALAVGGMAMFIIFVVSSVFAPGAGGPGPGPPLPPPSPVKVEKFVGLVDPLDPIGIIDYKDELRYNIANVTFTFSWKITLTNTSSKDATVNNLQDDRCKPIKGDDWQSGYVLSPGETEEIYCQEEISLNVPPPGKTIANIVTGKVTFDTTTVTISDMAKIVIGEEVGCQLNVPFFCQSDSQWKDTGCCWPSGSYPNCDIKDTIGNAGCGCTSQAMIINYHGGSTTPPERCGTYGCHVNGLTPDYLLCTSADSYFEAARRYLCEQDRPLIAIRKPSLSSSVWDHYAVITGIDPVARTVTLNDPYFAYSFCVPGLHMSFEDFYWEASRASPQCLVWY